MLIYLSTNNHKREPNVSSGTYWLPSFFSFFLAYFVIHNIVHPWPRIECPKDMTIDLSPGKRTIEVNIPQPATNVDYTSHVEAEPSWAKKLRAELGPIRMVISFRARNPVTEYTAICSFVLEVRGMSTPISWNSLWSHFYTLWRRHTDREAPTVKNCPHDVHVRLSSLEPYANAPWTEPVFSDNIAVTHVIKSKVYNCCVFLPFPFLLFR